MKKCYWREIYARGDCDGMVFNCHCNINDETCEALRLLLKDKYRYVTITTEYPNEDGSYRKAQQFTYNPDYKENYGGNE